MITLSLFISFSFADELTAETWNVGLAHGFVDHAEARIPALQESLGSDSPDILCIQEAWRAEDQEALVAAAGEQFPHVFTTEIHQAKADKSPACRIKELFGEDRFVSCMTGSCGGMDGDALTDCIVDKCGPILGALKNENPQCANALMAQVGKSAPKALWTVVRPFRKAGTFAYEGGNGLMLVSNLPLENRTVLDFTDIATLNRRQALSAEVAFDEGNLRVYCTHLTADLDKVAPYPGPFDSWNAENLAQVQRLIDHANTATGPTLLLGDFNCSMAQESQGIQDESRASCEAFHADGYADPVHHADMPCTYCTENTLVDDTSPNVTLDHLFGRGIDLGTAQRTREGVVTLETGLETHLSDHFGVALTVSTMAPPPAPAPSATEENEASEAAEMPADGESPETGE